MGLKDEEEIAGFRVGREYVCKVLEELAFVLF